jgi:hypothetical protein
MRGIRQYFSSDLGKRSSLIYMIVFTFIILFDSTFVDFIVNSNMMLSRAHYIGIFLALSSIFSIAAITLLKSLRIKSSQYTYRLPFGLKFFNTFIFIVTTTNIVIILVVLLQMIFMNKYNILALVLSTYLNHISALIFVSFLIYLFLGWLKSKKDYTILLYATSFILVSVSIVISLAFVELYYLRSASAEVRPYPINMYVITITAYSDTRLLGTLFTIFSLASFSVIWIATVALLSQYRYTLGKTKYFTLISIPLVYYLVPLGSYFGDPFSSISLYYPVTFSLIYALLFSATKQVGAVLFSLVFWTASSLVTQVLVRKSILVSAIGMALLFGSITITPLQYKIFPPFGFVTQAVMPLGAYLLLLGIFTSAKNVSQDSHLRKQFYDAAKNQLTVLRTMGMTEMEKQLIRKYKSAATVMDESVEKRDEEDVKVILRQVLNELYPQKTEKTKE